MNNQTDISDWFNGIIVIKKNKKIIYTKDIKENSISYNDTYFEDIFLMLNSNLFNFDYLLHEYLNENS
tara:strand:- start:337 stop:540 length:204 start_codon:yes stop_codon:yes gene_type:complete